MSFQPETTIYLLSGTGIDRNNSIWWHRFAYPTGNTSEQATWWNAQYYWFKSHAVASVWYSTFVEPSIGRIKVGRVPLNNQMIPSFQDDLGRADKRAQLQDVSIPYVDAIRGCDYMIITNSIETSYCFLDNMRYINHNTAEVYFTVDAIQTYQKFFHLGRSHIIRDMQHRELINGVINFPEMNRNAEPFLHGDNDFVFQEYFDESVNWMNFGSYKNTFVVSDVDLQADKIEPNRFYQGIPSFTASGSTKINDNTELGIGVYMVPERVNNAFNTLGSFNAMEHVLNTYVVPQNLTQNYPASGEPVFVDNCLSYSFNFDNLPENSKRILMPRGFNDNRTITTASEGYNPLNMKCYFAPYSYYSIGDKQGGSLEIVPQAIEPTGLETANYPFVLQPYFTTSVAPNTASSMYLLNYRGEFGIASNPLQTIWQLSSYVMTPNDSGYNNLLVNAIYQKNLAKVQIPVGSIISFLGDTVSSSTGLAGNAIGAYLGGPSGASLGGSIGNSLPNVGNQIGTVGNGIIGGGITSINGALNNTYAADAAKIYGLPKGSGGVPQGFTMYTIFNPGYTVKWVHLATNIIKFYDTLFSIGGYEQLNEFRYPHINTRRHWCFVKTSDASIMTQQANEYDVAGIPHVYRTQIEERLASGVTFWNLRHEMLGSGDDGPAGISSETDSRVQSTNFMQCVKNYGTLPDGDRAFENSAFAYYASNYDEDVLYPY